MQTRVWVAYAAESRPTSPQAWQSVHFDPVGGCVPCQICLAHLQGHGLGRVAALPHPAASAQVGPLGTPHRADCCAPAAVLPCHRSHAGSFVCTDPADLFDLNLANATTANGKQPSIVIDISANPKCKRGGRYVAAASHRLAARLVAVSWPHGVAACGAQCWARTDTGAWSALKWCHDWLPASDQQWTPTPSHAKSLLAQSTVDRWLGAGFLGNHLQGQQRKL